VTVRTRTFSQAPQAVRSARSRRWDGMLPASAGAGRALQTDKRDALGLTVQVHRFRDISSTAAIRAVVRTQSSPPSLLKAFCTTSTPNLPRDFFRYESRTRFRRLMSLTAISDGKRTAKNTQDSQRELLISSGSLVIALLAALFAVAPAPSSWNRVEARLTITAFDVGVLLPSATLSMGTSTFASGK
jgi:hypothetical protein